MKAKKRGNELLARWYAGETTEAEERLLRERLHADPEAADRADWLLLTGFEALAEERMPAAQRGTQELAQREVTVRAGRSDRRGGWIGRRWIAATVAAAAMVVVGLTAAWSLRTPYCYIDGVAIYDPETALAATSCLHELDVLSLSDELLDRLLEYDPLEASRTTINL